MKQHAQLPAFEYCWRDVFLHAERLSASMILDRFRCACALQAGIERVRQTLPFAIDAWVLLPGHLHCIWTLPKRDAGFSARWRVIKICL